METPSDHDLLIRLETKVDQFISSQADHEARLRIVEQAKESMEGSINTLKWVAGFLTFVSTILTTFFAWYALWR